MKPTRRRLSLMLLVTAVSAMFTVADSKKPNIVMIIADDLGWNDIGYHGAEFPTPTLDALAASGVKLENYYVQPKCSPTRGQLMSGRYQIHTGLQSSDILCTTHMGLPLELPTLADMLKQNGYATHIVGKWHLGMFKRDYLPTHRGFDTHYGYYTAGEDYYSHMRSDSLDFHLNEEPLWDEEGYSTELFRDRAIYLMKDHIKNNEGQPLFLYLPFQAVHEPAQVPNEYVQPLSHIKDDARRIHGGMVSALDQAIGDIKSALKENGLWDDTLLIFSTDNGGAIGHGGNNWPLRGSKGSYWEGGIRGVSFVSGPFLSREGATSQDLMHVTDWFPTLVHLAGGETTGMELDGYDIWKTLRHGKPSDRKELLHNIDHVRRVNGTKMAGSPFDNSFNAALRIGNFKLLTGRPGLSTWTPPPEQPHLNSSLDNSADEDPSKNLWLFDLSVDPQETTDLSTQHPDIVMVMLEKLAEYDKTVVPPQNDISDPAGNPPPGGVWGPWVE